MGFEPMVLLDTSVFKTDTLNHSVIYPNENSRIRTCVGVHQQIYNLPPLTTRSHSQKEKLKDVVGIEPTANNLKGYCSNPWAIRPKYDERGSRTPDTRIMIPML